MKICLKCEKTKKLDEFYKHPNTKDKLRPKCKLCHRIYNINRKDIRKDQDLLKAYGITLKDYNKMIKLQKGLCAICANPPSVRALAVDHCHKTNKVRALLCLSCNQGIGNFREDPSIMREAISYIKKYN